MAQVKQPRFKIEYNGKNITRSMTDYLLSITYTDKVIGETDELEIVLEDTDLLWCDSWYPEKGARLKLWMGYDDVLGSCGEFEIDEICCSGPPDIVTIKALAAWVTSPMRTKESKAWEGVTLKQIAQDVAAKHSLELTGHIITLRFERQTQKDESDLAYLNRIAQEYGYTFSIKGSKLVFTSIFDLEKSLPVLTVDRSDLISYSIIDKTAEVYKDAQVEYTDPNTEETVTYNFEAERLAANNAGANTYSKYVSPTPQQITNNYIANSQAGKAATPLKQSLAGESWEAGKAPQNTLHIKTKAENKQQAEAKAQAALHKANSKQREGSAELPGNPLLVAGCNFDFTGAGKSSGRYHLDVVTHRMERSSGYTCGISFRQVGYIEKVKTKPKSKKKRKAPAYIYKTVE